MPKVKGKLPDRPVVREELNSPELHDESHARDLRCVPMAHYLIQLLANIPSEGFKLGSHVKEVENNDNQFLGVTKDMIKKLIDGEFLLSDATYICALARQAIQIIEDSMDETFNQNMNRNTELMYGLPLNDHYKVTIKQLNDVVQHRDAIAPLWKEVIDKPVSKE